MATDDFFRARLDHMIDMRHPLAFLATSMPWTQIEASLAPLFAHRPRPRRRVVDETTTLLEDNSVKPVTAVVDLGYRGVDHLVPIHTIHRGRYKTMTEQRRRWLKRRQAIEPTIGHTKHDHGMKRCWLKGANGNALHAVLCAAGFNIR